MKKLLTILSVVALSAVGAQAQSPILSWDVTGNGSPADATLPADGTIDPNLDTSAGLNELSRVTVVGTSAANSFNSNNWNTTDTFDQNAHYITFSLQADPGFVVNMTSLQYAINGSNTAPATGRWGFSTDGGTSFTLQDTFTITQPQPTALAEWDFADVSGVASEIEFRFWAFGTTSINGGTSASSGTVRIANIAGDDLILNGAVIPEPSTLGLMALGLLAVGGFARRRMRRS